MSKQGSAYGTPAGDTEFRKTRDVAEYAAKAKEREAKEREEGKARYEARLAGKRYYKPLEGNETLTAARTTMSDLNALVGTTQMVAPGRRAGPLYCKYCDWTAKDSVSLTEHENSMYHLRNVGQTGQVKRASAADVLERIEAVWARLEAEKKDATVNLKERLAIRQQEDDAERERRRIKKRDLAEKKKAAKEAEAAALAASRMDYGDDVRIEGEHDEEDMMKMMGITGFGSTKKN
ncbi:U4/U6.U5 tri-snRNP component SNU23 [Sporothrix brasiliensis 5110]|uniref:U4/U6.U5 tri-snRNP component SNU23 n=1 Tax=Sporothrix brasiliensis 5110 TaxID=1398154 RepID=A0A0C2IN04_9PEZI|nr:U4/U6.U5 tri-snRNP component SNU23 [Sporothrix brasiliensis 5110]KIH86367.1 U4/U6.U5 tri-snRNP component SNU23 [Sporothrix brasiliensis 5110]